MFRLPPFCPYTHTSLRLTVNLCATQARSVHTVAATAQALHAPWFHAVTRAQQNKPFWPWSPCKGAAMAIGIMTCFSLRI